MPIKSLPAPYQELLYRYALRLVQNKLVAILIVEDVAEYYHHCIDAIPTGEMRNYLKAYTLQNCRGWLSAKDNTLHAREPKDPT